MGKMGQRMNLKNKVVKKITTGVYYGGSSNRSSYNYWR
jgi:hypothetical protein